MKAFVILLISFLFFSYTTRAQEYFPFVQESRCWSELTFFQSVIDTNYKRIWTTSYKLEGDITNGNGKSYKQLYTCDSDPSISTWNIDEYAFREESGKVFRTSFFSPDQEELVYDFTLAVGDSVYVDSIYYPYYSYYAHVLSVDSILTGGSYRKQIHFEYPPEIWVEGIGSLSRPFMPFWYYFIYPDWYELLCVNDTTGNIYMNPAYDQCYIDTLMTTNPELSSTSSLIQVIHNPMHEYSIINVRSSAAQFTKYSFYNSNGLLVRNGIVNNRTFTLRRENLSSGVYFLKIIGEQDVLSKIIIID
jgi:hypothetical protein